MFVDPFWEFQQYRRIADANSAAHRGEQQAFEAHVEVQRLEAQVHRLTLINQAMWTLLKESAGFTDDRLTARVQELEAAQVPGPVSGAATLQHCPQCSRTLSQKHHRCLFCGYQAPATDGFLP
jgi:hypothetical protein